MKKNTKNIKLTVILISTLIFLYTYSFSYLSVKYFYIITILIETLILGYLLFRLILTYSIYFVYFMFNSSYKEHNKIIEKPRLLFHLVFMPVALIFYNSFIEKILIHFNLKKVPDYWYTNYISQNIELSIYLSCFAIAVSFVFFTRTKQFENYFVPSIQEKLNTDEISLEFNEENNLKNLFDNELIGNNRCIITFENLKLFSEGQKMTEKAKWIDLKGQKSTRDATSKEISYGFIFDMLHENIIKDGIKNLSSKKRRAIMELIIENFTKGDDTINYLSLNKSYTNWKPLK